MFLAFLFPLALMPSTGAAQLSASARPVWVQAASAQSFQQRQEKADPSKRITLHSALDILSKKYRVIFEFNDNLVRSKTIDPALLNGNESLDGKLKRILYPLDITYERYGRDSYLIYRVATEMLPSEEKPSEEINPKTPVNLHELEGRTGIRTPGYRLITFREAGIDVRGTVTDEKGEGLPGVSVMLKGSSDGTLTDVEGRFKLTVPDKNAGLCFLSWGS